MYFSPEFIMAAGVFWFFYTWYRNWADGAPERARRYREQKYWDAVLEREAAAEEREAAEETTRPAANPAR